MSCSNYKFEWIDSDSWRLTSRQGMVWEGTLLYDAVDTSLLDSNNLLFLNARITKGDNNPIPINGLEKIRFYVGRAIVNGIKRLASVVAYGL